MAHRSTALPLAFAFVALVLYASLYPFEGWRWPPGVPTADVIVLPWPMWRDRFDEAMNFAGYVPLGALVYGALVRGGVATRRAFVLALLLAGGLSYGVEVAQTFLPQRVPSLRDSACNVAGAAAGALLSAALFALGWVDRWHALRVRWFARESAFALGLVVMWPVALLFPAPVPLGLGGVWGAVREAIEAAFAGTPWAEESVLWLGGVSPAAPALTRPREALIIGLGLLAPILVAFSTSRPGWHRLPMILGAAMLALGMVTLSTLLNFGPQHATAWWGPSAAPAMAGACLVALALVHARARLAAACGLLALGALVVLVAQSPTDPYYASSLKAWELGRFVRFHGLAQWIGWLWPYAAMLWLLGRVARRVDE
jgi:VanZ family protein